MMLAAAIFGTHHVEADLQMGLAGLLETFVTTHQLRVAAGDDVALAEQRPACRFAGRDIADRVIARKRTGIVEILMFVDSGLGRRAARGACQHQRERKATQVK